MAGWTAYASLLETLPTEKRDCLEAVAEAQQCGRHNEAHEKFKSGFLNPHGLPLLALQYADLLTNQGLEGERVSFLEEAVRRLQRSDMSSERRLLDLMLADSKLWAYGSLRNAVTVARRSRSWLGRDPTKHLSDLCIRGIQLYHQLMKRGFLDSNWVNQSELTVFEEFNGNVAAECAALSLSLKSQGRLAAAARMMEEQLSATDESTMVALCQEMAAFCDELDATKLPAMVYRSAYTRLSIVDHAPKTPADQVDQYWSAARVQLQSLAEISGTDWSTFAPKLSARLEIGELKRSDAAPAEVAAALASVADRSIASGDYWATMAALHGAASACKKLANQAASRDSAVPLQDYLSRLLVLHQQTTKSLYFEATALLELFFLVDLKKKAHEDILNEVAKFDCRATLFDVPAFRERLYSAAMSAARAIGREDLLETYDRAHDKAYRESFREEQAPTEIAQVITRISKNSRNALEWGRNAVEISLMWTQEQYQCGMMSQVEWEELFGFYILKTPSNPNDSTFLNHLECVRREYRNFSKSFFNTSREHWELHFRRLRGWLAESNDRIPWESRHLVLSTIADAWKFKQRDDWMKKTHTDEENARFMEHMKADMTLANEIHSMDRAAAASIVRLPVKIAKKDENVFQVLSQIKTASPLSSDAIQQNEFSDVVLDQAIQDSEDVFQEYQKRQNELGMFTALRRHAELLWNKFMRFKTVKPEDAIAALSRAEKVYDEVRHKRSVPLAQHYSIAGKMQQLRKYDAGDLYDKAICWSRIAWNARLASLAELQRKPIDTEGGEAAKEERRRRLKELNSYFCESYFQFVSWTQKSKGRAIFDLLSLDSPIPQELLRECNENFASADMIRRERELVQGLEQSQFPQLLDLKEQLGKLRAKMRQDPLMERVMRIRDGETIDLKRITEMLAELPDGVVLVDFIYVGFDKPLRALCYRKNLTYSPALIHDISMDILKAWTKNLAKPFQTSLGNVTSGAECLSQLTPLLAPLFKVGRGSPNPNLGPVIRPGETIVFCPSGVLHKLPLHAIPIDGVPLIEKHPVVYCPSLTILHHCLQRSKSPKSAASFPKRLVLNPMPSHWDKANSQPVKSTTAVKQLADNLGAQYLHGCEFSKHSIIDSLNDVAIFHYHGHVQFERGSAMKSYMVLDEMRENSDADDDGPLSENRLTAEDLFSCKLAKGALVTLVGCQSGGADVSAADDVLGIPMGMFYAGAAATVSSLWRLHDEDGAAWAEAFYDDIRKQGRDGEQKGDGEEKSDGEQNNGDGERRDTGEQVSGSRKKQGPDEGSFKGIERAIEKESAKTKGSDAWHGDLTEDSNDQRKALVNLAVAMQQAIHRLRFDASGQERAPYHWAGYILSGSWFFPLTPSSRSSKRS